MQDLQFEIYIAAEPQQVWRALTESQATRQIYYGSELRSTFETGTDLAYVGPGRDGDETVHIHGTILEIEPGRRLSHTCRVGAAYGAEHADFETRVAYELEQVGPEITRLQVRQDGWQAGDPSYENTARGWPLLLSSLKSLVETGQPIVLTADAHA